MRLAIETTALELDRGGTARVIGQLRGLLEADPEVDLVELRQPGSPANGSLGVIARGISRELNYFGRSLPREVARLKPDLLHCTSTLAPMRSAAPMAITVHDAIGWDHPEWLTRANVLQLKHVLPRAVSTGAHVITSSHYSARRIAENLDLEPSRIHVAPPGVGEEFNSRPDPDDDERLEKYSLSDSFALTVGTLQPRKNIEAAIDAFERIAPGHPQLKLAIVGARGWGYEQLLELLAKSKVGDRVVVLGRVDDSELRTLYRRADCLVFPSRYEGFGFPPLEAMASGTPVISTDNTSLAEAIGDAASVIDPDDPEQIARCMDSVLTDSSLRNQLAEAGLEQAARFTPERFLRETLAAYRTAIADQT